MIALIDMTATAPENALVRLRRRLGREDDIAVRRIAVFGVSALHIMLRLRQNITQPALARKIRNAGKIAAEAGVTSACFPAGFPYKDAFAEIGLTQPNETPFYEAMAAKTAAYLSRDKAAAYFFAERRTNAGIDTLIALCENNRHVLADVPPGWARHLHDIKKRLGIAIIENPTAQQLLSAKTAIFMDARRRSTVLSRDCAVYAVNAQALSGIDARRIVTGLTVELPSNIAGDLPAGFPQTPLLAEAIRRRALHPAAIKLRGVTICK